MNSSSTAFVQAVVAASWQGGLIILLILLLRPILGVWMPARWRALLWLLVLLRLLVPAFLLPPSPVSLQNLAIMDRPLEEAALAIERVTVVPAVAPERMPSQGPEDGEAVVAVTPMSVGPEKRSWWRWTAIIWASGCGLTALWICAGTLMLHRRLRAAEGEVEPAVREVWERCRERVFPASLSEGHRAKARRRKGFTKLLFPFAPWRLCVSQSYPRLRATDAVSSPALLGVFRPVLLIPRRGCEGLSAQDWEHIFLHELAHFRRRDHWLQALQLVALCAHWFNPLVWFGFRFLRADRELAADEWALRRLGSGEGERSAAYGATLLKVLSVRGSHPRIGTQMAG